MAVNVNTEREMSHFDASFRNASVANQINICSIIVTKDDGSVLSSFLQRSTVVVDITTQGEGVGRGVPVMSSALLFDYRCSLYHGRHHYR